MAVLMESLTQVLDPQDIMNPGKVLRQAAKGRPLSKRE